MSERILNTSLGLSGQNIPIYGLNMGIELNGALRTLPNIYDAVSLRKIP